jgi:hypothetical protein
LTLAYALSTCKYEKRRHTKGLRTPKPSYRSAIGLLIVCYHDGARIRNKNQQSHVSELELVCTVQSVLCTSIHQTHDSTHGCHHASKQHEQVSRTKWGHLSTYVMSHVMYFFGLTDMICFINLGDLTDLQMHNIYGQQPTTMMTGSSLFFQWYAFPSIFFFYRD